MNEAASTKPVIGLIGGIGAGKSTVARLFGSLGCAVIDADKLAKEALQTDAAKQQLVQWWGPAILDHHGQVDRAAVGRIVFADSRELAKLEGLIHPPVNESRRQFHQTAKTDPSVIAIVDDTPLLLEKGLDKDCDVLVFVSAPLQIRLERVKKARGWSSQELTEREKSQMPLDNKAARADYVIDNSVSEAQSLVQVRRILSQILPKHSSGID